MRLKNHFYQAKQRETNFLANWIFNIITKSLWVRLLKVFKQNLFLAEIVNLRHSPQQGNWTFNAHPPFYTIFHLHNCIEVPLMSVCMLGGTIMP